MKRLYDIENTQKMREAIIDVRNETESRIKDFIAINGLSYIIALTGDSESDGHIAKRNAEIVEEFIVSLNNKNQYAIQTGGTEGGIPEIGARMAKKHDMPVVAVRPESTVKYSLPMSLIDLVIDTPDQIYGRTTFGSETPVFASIAHGAVIIGGGYGTLVEAATMLKNAKSRHRLGQLPVYLCPIMGTGKAADIMYSITDIDTTHGSFPDFPVKSGKEAAGYINRKLPVL